MTLIMAVLGGCLYRFRGMSTPYKKYFPRPWNQIAFALPYALACMPPYGSWWAVLPVLVLTTLGVLTGHGNYFINGKGGKDETTEIVIKRLKPYIPLYWYKVLGLSVTGLCVTIPCGIATLNPLIAISGALKGPCYAIASKTKWDTALAEFLTGAALWGSLAIAL